MTTEKLAYSNQLCEKCGEFAVDIWFDDRAPGCLFDCRKCGFNWGATEGESHYCVQRIKKVTNRKHNLQETTWVPIIQSEVDNLKTVQSTLQKEIERLEDILDGILF